MTPGNPPGAMPAAEAFANRVGIVPAGSRRWLFIWGLADVAVEFPQPDQGYPFPVGVFRYLAAEAFPAIAGKDCLRGVVPAFAEQVPRPPQEAPRHR